MNPTVGARRERSRTGELTTATQRNDNSTNKAAGGNPVASQGEPRVDAATKLDG